MPIGEFLLQGFSAQTHRAAVRWVLACPSLDCAIFSVAYINQSGVGLLSTELANIGTRLAVFAGIRNDITSRQGLEDLLGFGGKIYVVDTGARTPTYHPKIFFAKGPTEARLVIGSANLTAGGLNNNIEASVKLTLNLGEATDKTLTDLIFASFKKLPGKYPNNVIPVTTSAELLALEKAGRLLDESLVSAPHPAAASTKPADDTVPKIKLLVHRIYSAPRKATAIPVVPTPVTPAVKPPTRIAWEQVWISKPLTERDLTIPKSKNTHATGSINLDKGLLAETVDHRHYFRNDVFNGLTWTPASRTVDEALATFQLVVKDIEYGKASLRIAHTTSTTSRSYRQRNALTRLSWGPLRTFIANPDLLGRGLTLYRDAKDPEMFLIEID